MAKYLVVFEQAGEGCDYTIGCGTHVDIIHASNMDAAFREAMEDIGWYDYLEHPEDYEEDPWGYENHMESVKVYRVDTDDGGLKFKEFQRDVKERIANYNDLEQRKADQAEFERLAKKLGKSV